MRNPDYEPAEGAFAATESRLVSLANVLSHRYFTGQMPVEHRRPADTIYCPRAQDFPTPT